MKMKLVVVGLALALFAFAPSAKADTLLFHFTIANDGELSVMPSYGDLTLTLNLDGTIHFALDMEDSLTLISGQGNPQVFGFNPLEGVSVTASNFSSEFYSLGAPSNTNLNGYGSFIYIVAGPNVGSTDAVNALSFDVAKTGGAFASVAELVNANAAGFDFAAHVYDPNGTGGPNGSNTGFVATGSPVPEPATMLLLGTGLLGVGLFRRRNRK